MKNYFTLFIVMAFILSSQNVYSEDSFVLNGKVFAINKNGGKVPQFWENIENFRVSILGHGKPEEITEGGEFSFKLNPTLYKAGQKLVLSVNKKDSELISPFNGEFYRPIVSGTEITLILGYKKTVTNIKKEIKKNFVYSVQVLNTRDQTYAIQFKNQLIKDLKTPNVYIEPYMVSNMPDNGYEYKVKVGQFPNNKPEATKLKNSLERRYESFGGVFVTLKGFR